MTRQDYDINSDQKSRASLIDSEYYRPKPGSGPEELLQVLPPARKVMPGPKASLEGNATPQKRFIYLFIYTGKNKFLVTFKGFLMVFQSLHRTLVNMCKKHKKEISAMFGVRSKPVGTPTRRSLVGSVRYLLPHRD